MPTIKASVTSTAYLQVGNAFEPVSLQVQNDTVQLIFSETQPAADAIGFYNLTPANPNIEWLFPDAPLWAKANSGVASLYVTTAEDPLIQVKKDPDNTTTALPTTGSPFIGEWVKNNRFDGLTITQSSDTAGTGYVDFYDDDDTTPTGGSTATDTVSWDYTPSGNEFHQYVKSGRWHRVRYVPDTNPTEFRLTTYMVRSTATSNTALNGATPSDADASVVKSVEAEFLLASGKFGGFSVANMLGRNPDIDTDSTPEDIWDSGGVYTGFPVGAPEPVTAASTDGGDTGDVTITGLKSSTSTLYESETVAIGGTSSSSWYRIHTARYDSGDDTTFNLGTITIAHQTTTANVFLTILPGRSLSNAMVYTIPAGHTGYIRTITGEIRGSGVGRWASGDLWTRRLGESPVLRRPFTLSAHPVSPFGGITLQAMEDVAARITEVSNNDTEVIVGLDILVVED